MMTQKICDKLGLINDIDYPVNKTNLTTLITIITIFLTTIQLMVI